MAGLYAAFASERGMSWLELKQYILSARIANKLPLRMN